MRHLTFALLLLPHLLTAQPQPKHNLNYPSIPQKWNEGIPMGNGLLGCLVWQKEGKLRLALDRADLWDSRPMRGLERPEFSYDWVAGQVAKGEYHVVQRYFDAPYETEAGPTKLPGGAIELALAEWKLPAENAVHLDVSSGKTTIQWVDGQRFETFVHAEKREGWFRCTGFPDPSVCLRLLTPAFGNSPELSEATSVQGSDLARLGYPQSAPFQRNGVWLFHQSGWGGFSYEIAVCFRKKNAAVWEGVWSISSHFPQKMYVERAENVVKKAIGRGFDHSFKESRKWWSRYWAKSAVSIPDPILERQYYRDLYKFGCTARENGPMISLQAVWTADNGRLPPWKGDLHHDLNTQMSYWPAYSSNHLSEGLSYLRHLESNDEAHRKYTRRFFGTSGLNIPGVSTLLGAEMGGWIQYACSPTTAAWCAQHFYLHWRYSGDRKFLKYHAWPFLHDVAVHLEELTRPPENNANPDAPSTVHRPPSAVHRPPSTVHRHLPLSSSPEINNNDIKAWFPNTFTNYDLALTLFVFEKAAELAGELGLHKEAERWQKALAELPGFALEPNQALMFAPTLPYRESHRHFSHLMAIHPLGLLDWRKPNEQPIISSSLRLLDSIGTKEWCGYSYAWLGNLRARARDGAGARDALRIFAEAFVSPNSFHLNGDQTDKGYSSYTYDPFTLEGNFAFAAGLQEMLLQSQGGVVRVFPAAPADWKQFSFNNLRAEGAFLVSASYGDVHAEKVEVYSEKGGLLQLALPPGQWKLNNEPIDLKDGILRLNTQKGQHLVFLN
jgi:alpha-L-fucosidase 2